jgi:limonene 1,2-monooxygenase
MVLLDHLTRGRVMLGVGPGALVTDALMLGIDPPTQRPRMDEAMGIITRLLTSNDPLTYKSDWIDLHDARLHLRPFTHPHMPLFAAAAGSPAGMVVAGKYGLGVLSFTTPRGNNSLNDFWQVAEQAAAEHGRTIDRTEWRLVLHAHIAETREQALAEVKSRGANYWRDYYEGTMGVPRPFEVEKENLVDQMNQRQIWCIGTPDDLVAAIHRFDDDSGGFGGLMIQQVDWATREQVMHSFELIARYVKPRFQGSLEGLEASQREAERVALEVRALRDDAIGRARASYEEQRASQPSAGS